jgi:hypothetical protein
MLHKLVELLLLHPLLLDVFCFLCGLTHESVGLV